jgi:flagellin FlaB
MGEEKRAQRNKRVGLNPLARRGISGLETAIVLIAFVIVASAFAFGILNVGFVATEKSKNVASGGIEAASAAVGLDGSVYGYDSNSDNKIDKLVFWLKLTPGADSVDFNEGKTTMTFSNPRGVWANIYTSSDLTDTIGSTTYIVNASAVTLEWDTGSGNLLDYGEKLKVTIDLTKIKTNATNGSDDGLISANEKFNIQIKPPKGAVLTIERTAPGEILTVNDLE